MGGRDQSHTLIRVFRLFGFGFGFFGFIPIPGLVDYVGVRGGGKDEKDERDDSFLGRYIIAALAQKSMVTNRIFASGNMLAGISVDFSEKGFRGIRDFRKLVKEYGRRQLDV